MMKEIHRLARHCNGLQYRSRGCWPVFAVISPALLGSCNKQQHLGRLAGWQCFTDSPCLIFCSSLLQGFDLTLSEPLLPGKNMYVQTSVMCTTQSRSSDWAARPGTAILPLASPQPMTTVDLRTTQKDQKACPWHPDSVMMTTLVLSKQCNRINADCEEKAESIVLMDNKCRISHLLKQELSPPCQGRARVSITSRFPATGPPDVWFAIFSE